MALPRLKQAFAAAALSALTGASPAPTQAATRAGPSASANVQTPVRITPQAASPALTDDARPGAKATINVVRDPNPDSSYGKEVLQRLDAAPAAREHPMWDTVDPDAWDKGPQEVAGLDFSATDGATPSEITTADPFAANVIDRVMPKGYLDDPGFESGASTITAENPLENSVIERVMPKGYLDDPDATSTPSQIIDADPFAKPTVGGALPNDYLDSLDDPLAKPSQAPTPNSLDDLNAYLPKALPDGRPIGNKIGDLGSPEDLDGTQVPSASGGDYIAEEWEKAKEQERNDQKSPSKPSPSENIGCLIQTPVALSQLFTKSAQGLTADEPSTASPSPTTPRRDISMSGFA